MSLPVIIWVLLAVVWGSTWLFIKIGLDDLPPFTAMWLRFAVAGLTLLILGLRRFDRLPRQRVTWGYIALSGNLIFTLNYCLVYWGETHISSGLAAIVYTTLPLVGTIIAHYMLHDERLTATKLLGACLGIFGVTLIFSDQLAISSPMAIWGCAAIQVAVIFTAIASNIVKLHLRQVDPILLTGGQVFCALPIMMGVAFFNEGLPTNYHWTPMAVTSVLYLGVMGSALTFALLNWLFRHMEVTKTQFIPFVSTMIAVLLGWLVRGETLDKRSAFGAALILSGLFLATALGRKRPVLVVEG